MNKCHIINDRLKAIKANKVGIGLWIILIGFWIAYSIHIKSLLVGIVLPITNIVLILKDWRKIKEYRAEIEYLKNN